MNVDWLMSVMTPKDKAALCSGLGFWNTKPLRRVGLESIMMSDGPHGLRTQKAENGDNLGLSESIKAVCFPTASCVASSFDRDMMFNYGEALGEQCQAEDVHVILGPGMNIKRSPLCGRNFEYFSEDPYLAGEIATNYVRGVQSQNVGVSVKHFAANNQELRRMTVSSEVDERALREIYLAAFEKVVKDAKPWTIMCSYNKINGTYASENDRLLTQILRNEWGFDGAVISDWGATGDRVVGLKAGLDLEMPSSGLYNTKKIAAALKSGELTQEELDTCARRILELVKKGLDGKKADAVFDRKEHLKKAVKFAENSMVLLKNDGILPLNRTQKVAFIGEFADKPRYQGSGSSRINSYRTLSALRACKGFGNVTYAQGYVTGKDKVDPKLQAEAVECAKDADVAVIFAGLTDSFESEGFDRSKLDIPTCQNKLIYKILEVQKNVVVVLHNGSPVTMPWLGKVNAVLESYLGGDGVGVAQRNILFGKTNPSGKLAETFPKKLSDVPCNNYYPGFEKTTEYKESIYVGYRYYDKQNVDVLFPFGHGLSYTTFEYSDIEIKPKTKKNGSPVKLTFKIKNTGEYDGSEVAQVYVSPNNNKVWKATKELKGFEKIFLKKGEEKEVEIFLDDRAFAHYDTNAQDWKIESGKYDILVASSSRDIRLTETITVKGDEIQTAEVPECYVTGDVKNISDEDFEKLLGRELSEKDRNPEDKITLKDTLENAKNTKWGGKINSLVYKVTSTLTKTSMGNGDMFAHTILELPIEKFITMSEGKFTQDMAESLVKILNDEESGENVKKILKALPKTIKKLLK